jgi:hypothetical protein
MQKEPEEGTQSGDNPLAFATNVKIYNPAVAFGAVPAGDMLKTFFASNPTLFKDVVCRETDGGEWEVSGRFVHIGKSVGVPARYFMTYYALAEAGPVRTFTLATMPVAAPRREFSGCEEVVFKYSNIVFTVVGQGKMEFHYECATNQRVPLPKLLEMAPRMLFRKACQRFKRTLEYAGGKGSTDHDKIEDHLDKSSLPT